MASSVIAVAVLLALVARGCSNEAARSALASEAGHDEGVPPQSASASSSVGPSVQLSEESEQPDESGEPVGAVGSGVTCPNRAVRCKAWEERPATEGWIYDVECPEKRSNTQRPGVWNLSTVNLVLAVRGIDCQYWSSTGNPGQITGTVLPVGGAIKRWPLEASQSIGHRFTIGVFIRKPDGTLDYRGDLQWDSWELFGDQVLTSNTGSNLRDRRLQCRQHSLGSDPNRWSTRTSFLPLPIDGGTTSPVFTIYSDGVILYGVRCLRTPLGND